MPGPIVAAAAVATSSTGRRLLLALLAFIALALAMIALSFGALVSELNKADDSATFGPSDIALADIPGLYLQEYLQAGQSKGIDWAIIAAIGSIETDHGRSTAPGVQSGVNSYGCCAGPMQFLIRPAPGTWGAYGVDGDQDGRKNVYDPQDAIPAAADYLKASGAPDDYQAAIFAYNHAGWYVSDVLAKAAEYRGALSAAGGPEAIGNLTVNLHGAREVLRLASGPNPRITLNAMHRNDLSTGQIDTRVTSLLVAIAHLEPIRVSSLKGDHSVYTSSGNVSNHSAGRAVDIDMVGGEACNSLAQGIAGKCFKLGQKIARIRGPLHPTELIYGLDLDGAGPAFAAGDHTDHIHAGWEG